MKMVTYAWTGLLAATTTLTGGCALPLAAQSRDSGAVSQGMNAGASATYADLVDFADSAQIVLRATVRKQAQVEPERAPGLAPGYARLYIQARTTALIAGAVPIGESLAYLVDVPLDSRGKVPKLKKREMLLFARTVPGQPGFIQLAGQGAQMPWSGSLEARLRPILASLVAPDAPPVVTGVGDALSAKGNLAGESETQLFLDTQGGEPVSVTIVRRPGQSPVWGVSWSEIVDQAARPPVPETLSWYRLACFLPARLPSEANLSREADARQRAENDYLFMMGELGPCRRSA